MKVTIKDIARETELSPASVSNILRGSTLYAEATRKHVWDAAHRLHYIPNREAQELRRGANPGIHRRNHLIMRIDHMGAPEPIEDNGNALRQQIFDWETLRRGYFPTVYWYYQKQGFRCPPLIDNLIDGVLLGLPHPEVAELFRGRLPAVLMDVPVTAGIKGIPRINMNLRQGFADLLPMLGKLGFEDFIVFGFSPMQNASPVISPAALAGVLNSAGFAVPDSNLFSPAITSATHWKVMGEFCSKITEKIRKNKKKTLIACVDIPYAEAIAKLFGEKGIRVPEDVSILTVDSRVQTDDTFAAVAYDWRNLISKSLDVLVGQIENRLPADSTEYLVPAPFRPGRSLLL